MAATGAIVAAAIAQANKASGAIVSVEPEDFLTLVSKMEEPLVVMAEGGLLTTNYQYLMNYKGLFFFTKSPEKLPLPFKTELVTAKSIWIPG